MRDYVLPSLDRQNIITIISCIALVRELWQAAVNLRGLVEPADYKRYVLPEEAR